MKKMICFLTACVMLMSTTVFANDYTYEFNSFVANIAIPQSGACDLAKSYAGHENEIDASEYFSGIISAFRTDLDADGDKELVFVGDNAVRVYKMVNSEITFVDSYIATLVCDYGESFANVFIKNHNGRDYLCVETFEDTGAEKSYQLKMMYLKDNTLKLANSCSVEKTIKDDYLKEAASARIGDDTASYTRSSINGTETSTNTGNYTDLYDAAWQMLYAMGFEKPSFLNSVNRLILDQTDADMHFELTNLISDIDLKTYVRASGIRVSKTPVVYFVDTSELQELMVAPTPTVAPTMMPYTAPTSAPEPAAAVQTSAPADEGITVTIDGEALEFPDQKPVMRNDRVLVPMRAIFEKLGASVTWFNEYRTVVARTDSTEIAMKIDDTSYYVGEEVRTLDVPPQIINDRTMIPVRAVSESLGCTVEWDGNTKTVIIKTAAAVQAAAIELAAQEAQSAAAAEAAAQAEETTEATAEPTTETETTEATAEPAADTTESTEDTDTASDTDTTEATPEPTVAPTETPAAE